MPTYRVTAPDGRRVRLTGDSPPTEAELEEIFAKLPAPKAKAAPDMSAPEVREVTDQLPALYVPGLPAIPRGVVTGALKGLGRTVVGLGRMVKSAGGLGELSPEDAAAFRAAEEALASQSSAERAGAGAEQAAEFLAIPGPGKVASAAKAVQLAGQGLAAAGLTRTHGGSTGEAITAGVAGATPVGEGVSLLGRWVGSKAEPLVRAALKPTLASLRRITGKGGLDAKAAQLVRFVLDNRLTTPEQARTIVLEAEHELQRVLSLRNAPTDAPARALRYLGALERSAAKQGLPADDVTTIRSAAKEVLDSSLGEDAVVLVPGKGPGSVGGLKPEIVGRAPRTDMEAREALESARASSRWQTRKQWGEQKGARTEAVKAVERAERDAVKAAVPEAVPLLRREGQAIQAGKVLDRMAQRAANRDAVSLPAHVIAAGEIAAGRAPILAWAANWLRNNQLKAGIYADRLAKAIERGNAPEVAFYLQKLGVGASVGAAAGP